MAVIAVTVPAGRAATAQALYGTLGLGLASASLTLLSGELWSTLGAGGFWIMSGLCAAAAPLAIALWKAPAPAI